MAKDTLPPDAVKRVIYLNNALAEPADDFPCRKRDYNIISFQIMISGGGRANIYEKAAKFHERNWPPNLALSRL